MLVIVAACLYGGARSRLMLRAACLALVLTLAACGQATETATSGTSPRSGDIQVAAPAPGARLSSPLIASGVADNRWYFEAVFPAKLVGADGATIAEAPAIAASDWTQRGPVPFNIEMSFTVTAETPATLVLEEDMPGENNEPARVEIPVILTPPQ
jgi:hypothetical protein